MNSVQDLNDEQSAINASDVKTGKSDGEAYQRILEIDDGVIDELGALPPGALLTRAALAKIFRRETISISRAIDRDELPRPARLLGHERWTAGAIIRHHEKRMTEAAEDAIVISKHRI